MEEKTVECALGSTLHTWLVNNGFRGIHIGMGYFLFTVPRDVLQEALQEA